MENSFIIRKIERQDKSWIGEFIKNKWGTKNVISRRQEYQVETLPGFVAIQDNEYAGLITFSIKNGECQIVTLDSIVENIGIGTTLLENVIDYAFQNKCKRVWLITTNDNTPALRFFQTRKFKIKAIYCNEIEYSRKLKPEIPLFGIDSIPIRDEIELEYIL